MPETSAPKIQVQIPQSYIEYTINFAAPIIRVGDARGKMIEEVLEALKPHGFSLEGVEIKAGNKLNEHNTIFRRTVPKTPGVHIVVSYEKIVVAADNVDWDGAPKFVEAISAAVVKLYQQLRPDIASQQLILAMHVQLKDKRREEVVRQLVTDQAVRLVEGKADFTGVIITGGKLTIVVEASLIFANSLWVRFIRQHDPITSLEEMSAVLRTDEERFFGVLNLAEAL